MAVTGGADGTVRVWDLRAGTARGEPLRGHLGSACGDGAVDGVPVAVTGGADGTVRVWDLRAGTARGEALRGHLGGVGAVAIGEVEVMVSVATGEEMVPIATEEETVSEATREVVGAAPVQEVSHIPVAVTGGADGTVQVWDLRTGTARGEALRGHLGGVGRSRSGKWK